MGRADVDAILAEIEARQRKRAADMPTQDDALRVMLDAFERLKELGWAPAIYSPKDGTVFEAIEAGCGAPGKCHYMGAWPDGGWWMHEAGDLWPARPILWRPLAANTGDKPRSETTSA